MKAHENIVKIMEEKGISSPAGRKENAVEYKLTIKENFSASYPARCRNISPNSRWVAGSREPA